MKPKSPPPTAKPMASKNLFRNTLKAGGSGAGKLSPRKVIRPNYKKS